MINQLIHDMAFSIYPSSFLSENEQNIIIGAIKQAEKDTSGEIRLFIESHCETADPLERAHQIFFNLQMEKTALRNGVLVYLALKDKKFCLFGDEGIYQKTGGAEYWEQEVNVALNYFRQGKLAEGLKRVILDIGISLATHFPYDPLTDKNELPDEIVFGK